MTYSDLNSLTISELKPLEKEVARAIASYESRRRVEARAEVEEFARKLGFSISDLVATDGGKKRAAIAPKYRNPENPEQTWSGRGRKPLWFVAALEAGKSPDDMAI